MAAAVADLSPPHDSLPAWLVAILSVVTTIAGWKGLGPLARWVSRRLDAIEAARALERGDALARLTADLATERAMNAELRRDLQEEREIRATYMADVAALKERVDGLNERMAEDKRECAVAIRGLRAEIKRLQDRQSAGGFS